MKPGHICCHQIVCSWVPKSQVWQSPEIMTANMFAMAKSPALRGAECPDLLFRADWSLTFSLVGHQIFPF